MPRIQPLLLIVAAGALVLPVAGLAQGRWGGPGWGGDPFGGPYGGFGGPIEPDRSREGKITVARFVTKDPLAAALGHGPIVVASKPAGQDLMGDSDQTTFGAAMLDRLTKAGYDTARAPGSAGADAGATTGQVIELTITRTELEPPGEKHKPVSGEAEVGVSNHGMGYGLAVNVDLTKPLPPLIATRLEARIRDKATQTILWEGRAEVATRPGVKGWNDRQIATRLAAALLDGFPRATDKVG